MLVHGWLVQIRSTHPEEDSERAKVFVLDPAPDDDGGNEAAPHNNKYPPKHLLTHIPAAEGEHPVLNNSVDIAALAWLSIRRIPVKEPEGDRSEGIAASLETMMDVLG